jgi:hypothetical protein
MMMKKRYGSMFLALMAVLCFSLAGCGDNGDEKGPGEGAQGDGIKEESNGSLKITAQLYRQDESGATTVVSDYNGDIYVRGSEDTHYADGTISNGKINLTVPKPGDDDLTPLGTGDLPEGVTVSDRTARVFSLNLEIENGSISYGYTSITAAGYEQNTVQYTYVDKPLTMKGNYTEIFGTISIDCNFKAGWNTVISTSKVTSSGEDMSMTASVKSGSPSDKYKWILND